MKYYLIGLIERGLEKKVPAIGIALFRIFFGLVILQEIVFLFYFRHLIFDDIPYIKPASPVVTLALILWTGTAIGLIFGLFTKISSTVNYVFWVLFVLLTPMWHDFDGGFDQLMTSSSFILIFVNSDRRLSIDNLRYKLKFAHTNPGYSPDTTVPIIHYTLLLGVSLGLLYFDAAVHKLHAEFWMNGLGAWLPSTMPYYISPFDIDWLLNSKSLQQFIGYTLILFQFSFLFLFFRKFFRVPLLIIGVLFHLGIIISLNIYPFGFGMLVHYILLVPFKRWTSAGQKIKYKQPLLHVHYNANNPSLVSWATVLSHFDFQGVAIFHSVPEPPALPKINDQKHSDLDAFYFASSDGDSELFNDLKLLHIEKFNAYLFIVSLLFKIQKRSFGTGLRSKIRTNPTQTANPSDGLSKPPYSRCVEAITIYRFLIIVTALQINTTVYYGILNRFSIIDVGTTEIGRTARLVSNVVTSISHVLIGITPHALYMDDHFDGYDRITALTYIDIDGREKWVPFIAADGRFISPNWGRVHSMWANVAMHPPVDKIEFERLAEKVTAYWANELDIGTKHSVFNLRVKPIEISYRWVENLRHKNLSTQWSYFGQIRWREGRFSINYHNEAPILFRTR